jgi:hypothetical protein
LAPLQTDVNENSAKTGLANIFEEAYPNCETFFEEILSHVENPSLPTPYFPLFQ